MVGSARNSTISFYSWVMNIDQRPLFLLEICCQVGFVINLFKLRETRQEQSIVIRMCETVLQLVISMYTPLNGPRTSTSSTGSSLICSFCLPIQSQKRPFDAEIMLAITSLNSADKMLLAKTNIALCDITPLL